MENKKIGIALSGGGQRAAAFHLGVLKKLNDFKILENLQTISAISGGSIIAASYLLNKNNFTDFYSTFKENLKKDLELRSILHLYFIWRLILLALFIFFYVHSFLTQNIPIIIILSTLILFLQKYLFKIFPTGKSLQKVYDKIFYNKKFLKDLPDRPKAIFNSTNLQTGTLMTFSKNEINDSSYFFKYSHRPQFDIDEISLSFVVTASTGFAPLISPLKFEKKHLKDFDILTEKKINPELVDGGLYDNQGIYKLHKENLDIIICSDASAPYDRDKYVASNPFGLLMRTINILMKRIRAIQYVNSLFETHTLNEIAYFSIDWQYETCMKNFVDLLFDKKVRQNIIKLHSIPEEYLHFTDPEDKSNKTIKIIKYMKEKIGYANIIVGSLTTQEIKKISKISTRLWGLKEVQINNLIKHGEALTEIQLKLYCPSLF